MNKKGFSLIEIMAAIVILGIISLAFLPFLGNIFSAGSRTMDRTETLYEVSGRVENKLVDASGEEIKNVRISLPDGEEVDLDGYWIKERNPDLNIEFKTWKWLDE